jgi:hypothetical protein
VRFKISYDPLTTNETTKWDLDAVHSDGSRHHIASYPSQQAAHAGVDNLIKALAFNPFETEAGPLALKTPTAAPEPSALPVLASTASNFVTTLPLPVYPVYVPPVWADSTITRHYTIDTPDATDEEPYPQPVVQWIKDQWKAAGQLPEAPALPDPDLHRVVPKSGLSRTARVSGVMTGLGVWIAAAFGLGYVAVIR